MFCLDSYFDITDKVNNTGTNGIPRRTRDQSYTFFYSLGQICKSVAVCFIEENVGQNTGPLPPNVFIRLFFSQRLKWQFILNHPKAYKML
jgi:hypothetical protein